MPYLLQFRFYHLGIVLTIVTEMIEDIVFFVDNLLNNKVETSVEKCYTKKVLV